MKKSRPAVRQAAQEIVEGPFADETALPRAVTSMREKILEASRSGDIANLRPAIERNETLPLFGKVGDRPRNFATAIEFLRKRAYDGEGRETLALLEAVLTQPFAKSSRGPHVLFVWPWFAAIGREAPDAEMRLAMFGCISFADFKSGLPLDKALLQRAEIGEDGTWHAFGIS